ncbi:MAG TPA: SA1362 family protein [Virgibacillus sp.]|nr:SA1362 family protein [Virgibacillus sp.]
MKRSKFTMVVYFVIALAVIGVISQLMTSPGSFFRHILITLGMAVVLFGVFYYFFIKRKHTQSDEMKKYKQAVKQSNAKYKEQKGASVQKTETYRKPESQPSVSKRKVKKRSHLRVIDGYKDKNKDNRASN